MKFNLMRGKDSLQDYANILAEILKIDVEIFDDQLLNICHSNLFNTKPGTSGDSQRPIHSLALKTKKTQIVEDDDNLFVMSTPIIYNRASVGAIGLSCDTADQKNYIKTNLDAFTKIQTQISNLIVSKLTDLLNYEKSRGITKLFHGIFETIEDGILIVGHNDIIINHNKNTKIMLALGDEKIIGRSVEIKKTNTELFEHNEFEVCIGEITNLVSGSYLPISTSYDQKILIFKPTAIMTNNTSVLDKIIGHSESILTFKRQLQSVSNSKSNILITGALGTDKDQIAFILHELNNQAYAPFIYVDCGFIPDHSLELQMVDYVTEAEGGTLFLNDVDKLTTHGQGKLLNILEHASQQMKPRIISTTSQDLKQAVHKNLFRHDLYYNLNVIPLMTIPLNKRPSDLRLLVCHFIREYEGKLNKTVDHIGNDFWHAIETYMWPGNLRELKNIIEYSMNMLLSDLTLRAAHLPLEIREDSQYLVTEEFNLESLEKAVIQKLLIHGQGKLTKEAIAKKLGIGVATLYRKIEKYQL